MNHYYYFLHTLHSLLIKYNIIFSFSLFHCKCIYELVNGNLICRNEWCREAVRQRKALSRTSSNILLNSVQMGHNVHNLNQYHHINNYNNHPNECELTSKLKDLKEEDSQLSMSNIEVK